MSQRVIQSADISSITNSIHALAKGVDEVTTRVLQVDKEIRNTRSELAQLGQAFLDFMATDQRARALALAETRLVKTRQELDLHYGYYAEVRRHVTGILQATDARIVRQESMKSATENLMLSAPRYWLAPALVALAAWLSDNRPLAEKALAGAIHRDDEKTSLFFALIARRAGRDEACHVWLDRYFGIQNPFSLDRQSVILIDALSSGLFGSSVRIACSRRIESWVEELRQRPGFLEEQRTQWSEGLRSKIPTTDHRGRYPHLAKFSPNWAKLNASLNGAASQLVIRDHFQAIFAGEIPPSPDLMSAVDNLLHKLVTKFDDEELPLRRDERLCQLIIEENGNETSARKRYTLEQKTLDEQVSFTQLLTNAAMHPETSAASRHTQRFAIALSREWIEDAHQDITANLRAEMPREIKFAINDWRGQTQNGENEKDLSTSLAQHIDNTWEKAIAQIRLHWSQWAMLVLCVLLPYWGEFNKLSMGASAACLFYFLFRYSKVANARKMKITERENHKKDCEDVLKALLAETVEWRRDCARRDAVADEVAQTLRAITPEQYLLSTHDTARVLLNHNV
ncbi:MAG: hypothetical protein LBB76_00735 [Azoarcus sp.]|jgi:hypothetical protein|nr:hypothetical protein [Azoarcus sp.]